MVLTIEHHHIHCHLSVYRLRSPGLAASATIVLIAMSVGVLVITARPLAGWKLALILVTGTVVALAVVTPWGRDYFELALPGTAMLEITALVAGAGLVAMFLVEPISRRRFAPD